jgi:hypothetical protein
MPVGYENFLHLKVGLLLILIFDRFWTFPKLLTFDIVPNAITEYS